MKRLGLSLILLLGWVIPSYSQSVCFLPSACGTTNFVGGTITTALNSPGATFTAPIIVPNGSSSAAGLQFAIGANYGLVYETGLIRTYFNGSAVLSINNVSILGVADQSVLGATATPFAGAILTRYVMGSKSKTLTDAGAAVSIWRIAVPTNGYAGGDTIFTANSTDGTNRLTTTGRVTFAGADTAGTVTCGIGTPYGLATAYRRANTLVCTFTAVTATTNCDVQVTCTDDLAGAQTMVIESRLDMPTPNTVVIP